MPLDKYKVLGQVNPTSGTQTLLYNTPNYYSTKVSSLVVCNYGTTAAKFHVVAANTTGSQFYIRYNTLISNNDTMIIDNIGLNDNSNVYVTPVDSNSLSFSLFGKEKVKPYQTVVINYLVVGGGGAGGTSSGLNRGGGGGGGGVLNNSFMGDNKATYTITVGSGGTTVIGGNGNNGGNSVLSDNGNNIITAYGGGGGGFSTNNGSDGASGGGAGWSGSASPHSGGSSIYPGQGYAGGNTSLSPQRGGGGGGAGGPGSTYTPGPGLNINIANGSTLSDAFGRGAGSDQENDEVPTPNSGNGGQGSHYAFTSNAHGGQDGVVIIWWSSLLYGIASSITGTYTYSNQNGYHIYKFTGPGSIKL